MLRATELLLPAQLHQRLISPPANSVDAFDSPSISTAAAHAVIATAVSSSNFFYDQPGALFVCQAHLEKKISATQTHQPAPPTRSVHAHTWNWGSQIFNR